MLKETKKYNMFCLVKVFFRTVNDVGVNNNFIVGHDRSLSLSWNVKQRTVYIAAHESAAV